MIVKNTYGLSVILSEKSIRNRTTINRFGGSSLNRKRKLDTVNIKEVYKQICLKNQEANIQSQNDLIRQIQHLFPERHESDCFITLNTEEYDNRYPSISAHDIESDMYFELLVDYGRKWGYLEEKDENDKLDSEEQKRLLNQIDIAFIPSLIKQEEDKEKFETSELYQREKAFYEESTNFAVYDIEVIEREENPKEKIHKLRSMSPRTKQKVKKKVIAFSQVYKKLNFLTLTFINHVEDKQAVMILAKFLDNCTKQMKDFQYIWVAERQTKNVVFEDNIHFHLITNKYFKIAKYWEYWIKLQEKSGLKPREENFKASSAFDIRSLNAKNIKAIGQYITKYVTKNKDQFDCQVWNCSKKVSMFYTDFYSGYEFIENVEKVLECELEPIPAEYCTIYPIPLNRKTLPMYQRLKDKNLKTTIRN